MGLDIGIGQLESDELQLVNRVLADNGVAPFEEPPKLPKLASRSRRVGLAYTELALLKRAYICMRKGRKPTPLDELSQEDLDEILDGVSIYIESHLLCHSDAEGYFVPVDFEDVLYDGALPGGMLGSSQRLHAELVELAPTLGIEVVDGDVTARAIAELLLAEGADAPAAFSGERAAWFQLFEATRLSIAHRAVIFFE